MHIALEQCVHHRFRKYPGFQFIRNHGWEHANTVAASWADVIGVYSSPAVCRMIRSFLSLNTLDSFPSSSVVMNIRECLGIVLGIFKTVLCIHYIFSDLIGRVGGMFQFTASFAHIVTGNLYSFLVIISETE